MPGTPSEVKAAAYIADRFRAAGLDALPGGYLQGFKVDREPTALPAGLGQTAAGAAAFHRADEQARPVHGP